MSKINDNLKGKLSDDDIKEVTSYIKKINSKNTLSLNIMFKRGCENCINFNACKNNLYMLEGDVNVDTMFIYDKATELDNESHSLLYDHKGRYLSVILSKMNIYKNNSYVTPCIKCTKTIEGLNEEDIAIQCSGVFLMREILNVRPKKIVALGILAINTLRQALFGLNRVDSVEEVLGQTIDGEVESGYKVTVMQTLGVEDLLNKKGSFYNVYKKHIWNNIKNFYE